MEISSLLSDLASFCVGCFAMYVLKPFFGSYSAKKGENLATKEDIAQITRVQEEIKATISDNVWDRQKQWEMRRDVVIEAVQALGELEMALIALHAAHRPRLLRNDEQMAQLLELRRDAGERFDSCYARYYRSMFSADLVAGAALANKLSAYYQDVGMISQKILQGEPEHFALAETKRGVNEKGRAVIEAAQNALQIQIS